jgi:outer membrane protein assembly factor BamB
MSVAEFPRARFRPTRSMKLPLKSALKMNVPPLRLFAAAALAVATVSAVHASDWPQYRGPNLDGSTSEKIALKWPAGGPKVLWKTPTPNGFSSFTVAGGRAFTIVSRNVEGAPREVVVALDAESGKEAWAFTIGGTAYGNDGGKAGAPGNDGGDGPRSTPTISDGKVYVLSADLALYCLDAASGKAAWSHDLMKEFAGRNITWKNAASPLIEGKLVCVGGGGAGQSFLAFNKDTGALAWKSQDEKITHSTPVATTILGTRQIIFFAQSGLVSVNPADGALLWKQKFNFAVSTAITPVVAGDIVYCAAGYGVGSGAYKISKDGAAWKSQELWRSPGNQPVANHWSTPVYKDGHLYGMFQFKEYGKGPLKCVEVATGKVKWEKSGFGPGNVILVDGNILALADDGNLVTAEATPAAYKEISRAKILTGKCWSTPIVSNGRVYARSTKEAVCVDVSQKTAAK